MSLIQDNFVGQLEPDLGVVKIAKLKEIKTIKLQIC